MLSIGLMSGTSMDGIDAALLSTDGSPYHLQEIEHDSLWYDESFKILLKSAEFAVKQCQGNLTEAHQQYLGLLNQYLWVCLHLDLAEVEKRMKELENYLIQHHRKSHLSLVSIIECSTELHGKAVHALLQKTGHSSEQIDVIGYHGQTLLHAPEQRLSIIVGDGQWLSNYTDIPVVTDFRREDMEQGGQGAPLAPLYHQALAIRDGIGPCIVANCGGIANITVIPSLDPNDLIAFDTGPGNALIDRLVRERTKGLEHMDRDGQHGRRGQVNEPVLAALWEKAVVSQDGRSYFLKAPPKSLDTHDLHLISELDSLSLEDACATLAAFTSLTLVGSLEWVRENSNLPWILAGGGWNNPVILHFLRSALHKRHGSTVRVNRAEEIGWNGSALEAQLFAFLAVSSLQGQPLSFPKTTGVLCPLSGGTHYVPNVCWV